MTTTNINQLTEKEVKNTSFLSALSVCFEWYDFFLYAVFASIITKQFTSGLNDSWAFIFALVTFSIGFIFRPVGGIIFGYLGDKFGRKTSLLINILLMSVPTFMVSILPTYESVGIISPLMLFFLRILQGIALGGGWAGVSVYIAEITPHEKRSKYISYLGSASVIGLFMAFSANFYLKQYFGETEFNEWAWRLPFLASTLLLSLSVWIRLKFKESPTYKALEQQKLISETPFSDVFLNADNLKRMAKNFFMLSMMQVFYYTAYNYSLLFLTQTLKVNDKVATELFLFATLASVPVFLIGGQLANSGHKKKIYLAMVAVVAALLVPTYQFIANNANPELMAFNEKKITLEVNELHCGSQFNPLNTAIFVKSCDIAKNIMSKSSLSYEVVNNSSDVAIIKIDGKSFEVKDITSKGLNENKQDLSKISKSFNEFLAQQKYPAKADEKSFSYGAVFFGIWLLMAFATLLLSLANSIAVELFKAKSRVLAYSFSYNFTSIIGGLAPSVGFALVANFGNILAGTAFAISIMVIGTLINIFTLKFVEKQPIDYEGY